MLVVTIDKLFRYASGLYDAMLVKNEERYWSDVFNAAIVPIPGADMVAGVLQALPALAAAFAAANSHSAS